MALTQVSRGLLSTSIVDNGNATAITIDSSENVLVGRTASGTLTVAGSEFQAGGAGFHIRDGGTALFIGRKTSDGNLVEFSKDGTNVGSIGVKASNNMVLDGAVADHAGLEFGTHTIMPREAGADADATINLGGAARRFKDLYLSGTANVGSQIKLNAHSGYDERSIGLDSTGLYVYNATDSRYDLSIDGSGNLLVGKTASSVSTDGVELTSTGFTRATVNGDTVLQLNRRTSDGTIINFRKDSTTVGSIGVVSSNDLFVNATDELNLQVGGATKAQVASNGSLYLYAQATGSGNADLRYSTSSGRVTYDTSSRLVKAEIEDIPYGLSTVMALSPKRYQRTDSDNKLEVGFIADEVVEVVPELVGMMEKRFLTMNQEDTEVVAGSVEYNKMTAVLVKAIQEQQATIESQAAAITDLTTRLTALENN